MIQNIQYIQYIQYVQYIQNHFVSYYKRHTKYICNYNSQLTPILYILYILYGVFQIKGVSSDRALETGKVAGNYRKMQIELTPIEIEQDVENFRNRIEQARIKLSKLPAGFLQYAEYKKREKQRKVLQAEIIHVEKLISIVRECFPDMEC